MLQTDTYIWETESALNYYVEVRDSCTLKIDDDNVLAAAGVIITMAVICNTRTMLNS